MALGFWQTLMSLQADGTAITAASRTSMTVGSTQGRFTIPGNTFKQIGDQILLKAHGRISCAVTTPGTARFDLAFATVANFDSQAMPLNIVAQTTVPWWLEVLGTVRATGTAGNIMWGGYWLSEAAINTAAPQTGPGPGGELVPYGSGGLAPVVGANFDMTVSQLVDLYFTQTVTTGSCTLHQMNVSLLTATGF